ncbi:unnamed protein product [Didymodactylos carnosus]|uniref:Uncharacterized protein n=1 Tax=Didymodactylos carnosus TaxID=1234261 RepID=A0A814V7D6_9BILA|nr:unnamed protein product [Didymodactylos carnosus]CAF1186482.1 unnamed protein product [Didymodactylos carnosus]CAF3757847.1 unnamed protein product [Didymodactylos carnosus]CAF3950738.1 unnamed protein product [Didymodactylos carnosus]
MSLKSGSVAPPICVVTFENQPTGTFSLVPSSFIHSAVFTKGTNINKDYFFVHPSKRDLRKRGFVFYIGPKAKCQEYCKFYDAEEVDCVTWLGRSQDLFTDISNSDSSMISAENPNNARINSKTAHKRNVSPLVLSNSFMSFGSSPAKKIAYEIKGTPTTHRSSTTTPLKATTPTSKKTPVTFTGKNYAPPINETHVNNIISKNDVMTLSAASSIPNPSIQTPSKVALSQGVVEELENARRKIIYLEEQLAELKRISIPLTLLLAYLLAYPNAEQSLYLRNVVSVIDLNDRIASTRATEDGEKLPVSGIELFKVMSISKTWKKRTVNLVKSCYKNVDFGNMTYNTLSSMNAELMRNILGYSRGTVTSLAVGIIPSTVHKEMFS